MKILKRKILDELEVQGAHYTLCLEYLNKKRLRAIIYHQARTNLSDRLRNPTIWKQRPHKPKWMPYGYEVWDSAECCVGRKALFGLAKSLIATTRTSFKIRYGEQQPWIEVKCGGERDGQSLETWRERCLDVLKQQLGEREDLTTTTTNQQPTTTNQ